MGTTLRKTRVIRFSPSTASDALDGNDANPGACTALTNLIPDLSTKNVWATIPAPQDICDFGDLTSPTTVECFLVVGQFIYGLVATTSIGSSHSQPFCYQLGTSGTGGSAVITTTPVTVNNVTSANTPTFLWPTGGGIPVWNPDMVQVGNYIYVTHPNYPVGHYIGWFDVSIPNQPVWDSGNLIPVTGIISVGTLTGGSGYDSGGTAVFTSVPLTGGTGSTASATVFVTSGVVTRVVIHFPGTGYIVGDSLSASNANLGGSGTGFAIVVAAVQGATALQLTTIPQWVAQFYQRLWMGVNPTAGLPSVIFTDILARAATNANQALTFGDYIPTVAGRGLGLNNQLGGVIQSLMIFKGVSYIIQVTGDAALMNLATNNLSVATGTVGPRLITSTSKGLAFAAPDGLRIIEFNGNISDPIGYQGTGITIPFTYSIKYTNITNAMGCNKNIVRFSSTYFQLPPAGNGFVGGEWWLDLNTNTWSGIHSVGYTTYQNYQDGWIGSYVSAATILTPLYALTSYPPIEAVYAPNTNVYMQTCLIADPDADMLMSQLEITELQVMTTSPSGGPAHITVKILDQDGNTRGTQTFAFSPSTAPTTFGLYPRMISFSNPIVVTRFAVSINALVVGATLAYFKIGDIYVRVRDLGYSQELPG